MVDRPIIFSAPMVQALLAGRKTQTRRLVKKAAALDAIAVFGPKFLLKPGMVDLAGYAIGDRLYVREQFSGPHALRHVPPASWPRDTPIWCWADDDPTDGDWTRPKPSIHMPRWASRLTLTVTDVRVQRLQEITAIDAINEGIASTWGDWMGQPPDWAVASINGHPDYHSDLGASHIWDNRPSVKNFALLWNTLHGPDAWDANPWVVAISFTVARGNIDG